MPKIDFEGQPPFTSNAEVKLTGVNLEVKDHGHPCFPNPLPIKLSPVEGGRVLLGKYVENPECGSTSWNVIVVRSKKGPNNRLYGAIYPTPTIGLRRQSSGVWGADE